MKLHLGCGKRDFGSDWEHIDGGEFPHVSDHDISLLKYEDSSASLIYSSHLLAYFDRSEAASILECWHRVLREGGVLRVAVPDFGVMVSLYESKTVILDQLVGPLYGKMLMNGSTIYHKTVYDYESLKKMLTDAGFHSVSYYPWRGTCHGEFDDHSQAYIPHMDKDNGVLISLNVECKK